MLWMGLALFVLVMSTEGVAQDQGLKNSNLDVEPVLELLAKKYGNGVGLEGVLMETVDSPLLGTVGPRRVQLLVSPPGKLRWAYGNDGDEGSYVVKGGQFWMLDPKRKTAMTGPVPPGIVQRYLGFLTEMDALQKDFSVTRGNSEDDLAVLLLVPKRPHPMELTEIRLEVRLQDGTLTRLWMLDQQGSRTQLDIESLVTDKKIDADRFQVVLTDDWEVMQAIP